MTQPSRKTGPGGFGSLTPRPLPHPIAQSKTNSKSGTVRSGPRFGRPCHDELSAERQTSTAEPNQTQIVLLGTGNPPADPDRSGPATAVVVNGTPYLVDIGAGVVRRAKSAVVDRGIPALEPVKLRVVFVTHLHSDHTVGYPDLILTPWVIGRRVPLEVYGPAGIKAMTEHLFEAYSADFETRTKDRSRIQWARFPRAMP